jgi:uncharacterized protein (TIGR02266 family)
MPTFGIVLNWDAPARAPQAAALIRDLSVTFPREKVTNLEVIRRSASAVLYLEVSFELYGRAVLKDVEEKVGKSGGQMVELMRLGETEKAQFKAKFMTSAYGASPNYEAYAEAAKALEAHLGSLGVAPVRQPAAPEAKPAPAAPKSAAKPATPEARKDIRIEVELAIEFKTETEFVTEYTRNLSKGGVFVKTGQRPQQNTYAALKIHLPNGQTLETSARVVHVLDHPEFGGVGLAFEKRDPAFEAALSKYLSTVSKK